MNLDVIDPEIHIAISNEKKRQLENINLIASENYASSAVMEAQGSVFTNKYAEGYPGKRYYGGCEFVDVVENLAIDRAKDLFHCEYANVQPHSGAQANMAAYFSCLNPGDVVLGMQLDHGGHLTHGSKVNFSSKLYTFIGYGVERESETIDFTQIEDLAKKHTPKLIIAGASAYTRVIDFKKFRDICDSIGAKLMVDMAHISGLVATGAHPSPIEYADIVTTTTHKTLRGPRGGMILSKSELGKSLNSAVFPNMQGGPMEHTIAAKAVAFQEASTEAFANYQSQIIKNAKKLAAILQAGGLRIVSGGTDNHMVLVDLTSIKLPGKSIEESLSRANIVVNRNAIPYDQRPPRETSGIRLGTAAITTRGMTEDAVSEIGSYILEIINNPQDESQESNTKKKVLELLKSYPIPS
ncbi:MAG: serine hydroxymethyltransferase [Chloroflexi bacterium]|nr:serine hydroxymethyltransferase [Chloroflexota bacterium]|tara:strand:- start:46918 stop:48150 length:1233 start_codon:yes stop_codon:yes gene_type:complete